MANSRARRDKEALPHAATQVIDLFAMKLGCRNTTQEPRSLRVCYSEGSVRTVRFVIFALQAKNALGAKDARRATTR